MRISAHYRARDAKDNFDVQVSFDEGKTFKSVGKLEGPFRGMTKYIVVDFAAVNLFASAGIRVLILLLHKLDARDGALVLCGLNQYIRNVLDVSGLTSQFTIVGTIADAVKAMPAAEDTSETGQLARRVLKLLSIGDQAPAGASAIAAPLAQELADRALHVLSRRA